MEDDLSAKAAADAIVDGMRNLLAVLGALLATTAGRLAAQAAAESRSLPSLAKALRQLWFSTPLEGRACAWDSKQQAVWLCRLLAVVEGSREGLLSFYGAGLLLCEALYAFARASLAEAQIPMDDAWLETALVVQEALQGRHWEQLQRWPGDRRCGGGADPLLSTGRLPSMMRRTLDLDGVRLTKTQAAGLGVAMLVPGSFTISMGAIGCALLVKSARNGSLRAWLGGGGKAQELASEQWVALQSKCLDKAHVLMRRKARPVEVRYDAKVGCQRLKVCLYSHRDPICAVPVGAMQSGGSRGSQGVAYLEPGECCALRPGGSDDKFKLRVYQPAEIRDTFLEECADARRGDNFVLRMEGGRVRCLREGPSPSPASDCDGSPMTCILAEAAAAAAEAVAATEAAAAAVEAATTSDTSVSTDAPVDVELVARVASTTEVPAVPDVAARLRLHSEDLAAFAEAAAIAGGATVAQQAVAAARAAEAAVAAETAAAAEAFELHRDDIFGARSMPCSPTVGLS